MRSEYQPPRETRFVWFVIPTVLAVQAIAPLTQGSARESFILIWLCVPALFFALRASAARVEVDEDGIVVVNELRTHFVRWSEIARFEVGKHRLGGYGAIAFLGDGSALELRAIRSVVRNQSKDWRVARAVNELNESLRRSSERASAPR